jgi:osmotically-inducible protein OsmY
MFRLTVLGLAVGAAAYAAGYRWDAGSRRPVRTAGEAAAAAAGGLAETFDRERLRDARAEVGEAIAGGADLAQAKLAEARLTAKITSKMALDDTIEASRLDVDTHGTAVTVSGSVDTDAQRQRALQLARETEGVTSVVDRIAVNGR